MALVWILMFSLQGGAEFLGGEYHDEDTCYARAEQQLHHWRRIYGRHVTYTCRLKYNS